AQRRAPSASRGASDRCHTVSGETQRIRLLRSTQAGYAARMRERGRGPGSGAGNVSASLGSASPSVGKRTLAQRLPDVAAPASTSSNVDADAARGIGGAAQPYPHRAAIEASMGRSLPAKAFVGTEASAASATLGAEAYTVGDSVAFGTSSPSLRLAAHEAAHVVQQTDGVHLLGGDGSESDPLEQHADAV